MTGGPEGSTAQAPSPATVKRLWTEWDRLSNYMGKTRRHLEATANEEVFLGSVLIHSYALAENAAAQWLGADQRTLCGIEDWGERLLASNGKTWKDVEGGKAGAVELAITRNAFAHGTREIEPWTASRLNSAGRQSRPAGYPVTLDYAQLKAYRKTLRSLLEAGGLGRHVRAGAM